MSAVAWRSMAPYFCHGYWGDSLPAFGLQVEDFKARRSSMIQWSMIKLTGVYYGISANIGKEEGFGTLKKVPLKEGLIKGPNIFLSLSLFL